MNIFWIWSHFEANFTFYGGEATRDFITAKHIIEYGDTPLIGPYSAASQNLIKNSPAYFYFLALFLLFFKSFTALCIFSIALFLLTLTFIFLLAYKMLGLPQAIISTLIMSINPFFLLRSEFIWQPDIMLPFLNLSLLLLFIGYSQKKYWYIYLSSAVFVFAGAMHNSAFAYIPFFTVFTLYALYSQNATYKQYITVIATFLITFTLLYLPTFYYPQTVSTKVPSVATRNPVVGIVHLNPLKFVQKVKIEFSTLYYSMSGHVLERSAFYTLYRNLFAWLLIIGVVTYFLQRESKHKKIIVVGLFIIAWYLILISLLERGGGFQYFAPILGITAIIYAEIIVSFFKTRTFLKVGLCIFFFCATYIHSYGFKIVSPFQLNQTHGKLHLFLRQDHPAFDLTINSARKVTDVIANRIDEIKNEKHYPDYRFFEIQAYSADPQDPLLVKRFRIMETVTLAGLEESVAEQLMVFKNRSMGLEQVTQDLRTRYLFIVCYKSTPEICTKAYINDSNTLIKASTLYATDSTSVIEIIR